MKFHVYELWMKTTLMLMIFADVLCYLSSSKRKAFLSLHRISVRSIYVEIGPHCKQHLVFSTSIHGINCSGKNAVFNFQYGPQTQSVRDVYVSLMALKWLENLLALYFQGAKEWSILS